MSKKRWAIDLGTTNSAIAFSTNEKSEVVSLEKNKTMPSVIMLKNNAFKVMDKRVKKYYTTKNQVEIFENWKTTHLIEMNKAKKPLKSNNGNSYDEISAIKASSMVISKLIEVAEKRTGEKIKDLSISIPANFKEVSRQATLLAAKMAIPDLKEIKLIHEPTAAAAFLLTEYKIDDILNKNILVYDMGGGTLDISIVNFIKEEKAISIEVRATNGVDVAGKHFDNKIIEKILIPSIMNILDASRPEIKEKINSGEISSSELSFYAEKLKLELSDNWPDVGEESVEIEDFSFTFSHNDHSNNVSINWNTKDFSKIINGLIKQTEEVIQKTVKDANLSENEINIVVPAGSSSRAPWVKDSINEFFKRDLIKEAADPETAIAIGGSILSGINHGGGIFVYKGSEIELNEIVPTYVGVGTASGILSLVIDKGRALPTKVKQQFYINRDTNELKIMVYTSKDKNITIHDSNLFKIYSVKVDDYSLEHGDMIEVEFIYKDSMLLEIKLKHKDKILEMFDDENLLEEFLIFEKYQQEQFKMQLKKLSSHEIDDTFRNTVLPFFETAGQDVNYYKNKNITKKEKLALIKVFFELKKMYSNDVQ